MIIDSKLPGFKNYLSENRLTNGGIKTTIDQAAVAPSEQNNVDLDLESSTKNAHDKNQKKKKKQETLEAKKEQKAEITIETEADQKKKNLKLLNLL